MATFYLNGKPPLRAERTKLKAYIYSVRCPTGPRCGGFTVHRVVGVDVVDGRAFLLVACNRCWTRVPVEDLDLSSAKPEPVDLAAIFKPTAKPRNGAPAQEPKQQAKPARKRTRLRAWG